MIQHFNLGPAAPLASPLAPKSKVIDTKYHKDSKLIIWHKKSSSILCNPALQFRCPTVVQGAVIEFALVCNHWQTYPSGIVWSNPPMSMPLLHCVLSRLASICHSLYKGQTIELHN